VKIALTFTGCHRRGGVERVVYETAAYLASSGHDVCVYANEWEVSDGAPIRYEHVPMRARPAFRRPRSFFRECGKRLIADNFDVVNTHGCVCPVGGVFRVHSLHRAWLQRCAEFRSPFSVSRARQRLNPLHGVLLRLEHEHFRNRKYRKLIATTPEVKEDLGRYYGVPAGDVAIVPNGFSPIEFNPQRRGERRTEMRHRLNLGHDDVALLLVANELERKGYGTILSAMRQLGDPRVRLLVVGRVNATRVQRQAAAQGLADRVVPCGLTSDVAGFHAAADLLVLPTQYEAFCLAILEALGSGLPVVTSDVPGARDAVVAGVNGAIVRDPRDGEELACVLRPLLDGDRRASLSAAAPGSVRQYQWPNVLAQYEQVLLETVHSPVYA
jgi:UDP-glucose:(heptosyl)LPS alpha-1,3-glucosyltransferase